MQYLRLASWHPGPRCRSVGGVFVAVVLDYGLSGTVSGIDTKVSGIETAGEVKPEPAHLHQDGPSPPSTPLVATFPGTESAGGVESTEESEPANAFTLDLEIVDPESVATSRSKPTLTTHPTSDRDISHRKCTIDLHRTTIDERHNGGVWRQAAIHTIDEWRTIGCQKPAR
ncbi:hypothetical protein BDV95DRAFT_595990 [Massariosphaeria phaeospora]|uniref:Uncharacterized protein n=1 Tax=Massariosphaeria phaeospora TaxID=100035 RepID=A0A7C8M7N4_9PLEO|nr:hypothetical protein BDV95DRAFT_595990 [Massariosphaeria phaeospora]